MEPAQLPDRVREKLWLSYLKNTARNTFLYEILEEITARFESANISVIFLKGAHVAKTIYPQFGLRYMGDLDLMVKPTDLDKAAGILKSLGYQNEQGFYTPSGRHLPGYTNQDAIYLELHYNIANQPYSNYFNVLDLWERSVPLESSRGRGLSLEDLLLHLCIHAAAWQKDELLHPIIQLRHLVDIAEFLRTDTVFNWAIFAERAKTWQVQEPVYLALKLTQELLGLPPYYATQVNELRPAQFKEKLLETTRRALFLVNARKPVAEEVPETLLHFLNAQTFAEKLLLIWKTIFPPFTAMRRRYQFKGYGLVMLPLVYLWHPWFILFKYIRHRQK